MHPGWELYKLVAISQKVFQSNTQWLMLILHAFQQWAYSSHHPRNTPLNLQHFFSLLTKRQPQTQRFHNGVRKCRCVCSDSRCDQQMGTYALLVWAPQHLGKGSNPTMLGRRLIHPLRSPCLSMETPVLCCSCDFDLQSSWLFPVLESQDSELILKKDLVVDGDQQRGFNRGLFHARFKWL